MIAWIAWALAIATTVVVIFQMVEGARSGAFVGSPIAILEEVMWSFIAAVFALLAALIISKQAGNVVGWLLMTLPIGNVVSAVGGLRFVSTETAPTTLDPGLFLAVWFDQLVVGGRGDLQPECRWLDPAHHRSVHAPSAPDSDIHRPPSLSEQIQRPKGDRAVRWCGPKPGQFGDALGRSAGGDRGNRSAAVRSSLDQGTDLEARARLRVSYL